MNRTERFLTNIVNDNTAKDIINAVRASLSRTGHKLYVRGRNPNRKQYMGERVPNRYGFSRPHAYSSILPLHLSTYFGLYIRPWKKVPNVSLLDCKDRAEHAIKATLAVHNIKQ